MQAIYKKELRSYFKGAFGYVIVALLLLFTGIFTVVMNLALSYSDFAYTLASQKTVLIIIVPLLTMRSIAEERHSKTEQLLFSLPLRIHEIVLGKFFAMLTVFLVPTLISALYPLILSGMGSISFGSAYTAILGYFLMGAALIALCTLISSLVENQILAAALSVLVCLFLYFMDLVTGIIPAAPLASLLLCLLGELLIGALVWKLSKSLTVGAIFALVFALPTTLVYLINPEPFRLLVPNFLDSVNLFNRLNGFSYGYFDLLGVIFYLSFTALCLFCTTQSMEARRRG